MKKSTIRKVKWVVLLTIGIPVALPLLPVALIWYINASGLYQVARASRAREKRQVLVLAPRTI